MKGCFKVVGLGVLRVLVVIIVGYSKDFGEGRCGVMYKLGVVF